MRRAVAVACALVLTGSAAAPVAGQQPSPEEPPTRVEAAIGERVVLAAGSLPVTCRLDRPSLQRCFAELLLDGRSIGTGEIVLSEPGLAEVGVRIRVTDDGLRVLRRSPDGRPATVVVRATPFGGGAQLEGVATTTVLARTVVVLPTDPLVRPGTATLRPGARAALRELAGTLAGFGRLRCEGHTDARGPAPRNRTIALARSRAICRALVRGGFRGRTSTHTYGEARPLASNADAAGRKRNRRIELVVTRT